MITPTHAGGLRLATVLVLAAVAVGVLALLAAPSSQATYAGMNGLVVFQAPVGGNTQLFTIRPDGTGLKQITHFKGSSATNAAWSKDGSKIVFTQNTHPETPSERFVLYTVNADGSGLTKLPQVPSPVVSPNWFPDGRRLIVERPVNYRGGRLFVLAADGTGLRSAGVPGISADSVCFLADGKHVAFLRGRADDTTAIFVGGLFGTGVKRITPWGGHADKIDCSPDGKRIVYSAPAFSENGKSSNVYTMKTDGTGVVQLTHETGGTINAGSDSWSPDGKQIAFVDNRTGTYQIWTMNADGSGQKQLTRGAEAHLAAWGTHH